MTSSNKVSKVNSGRRALSPSLDFSNEFSGLPTTPLLHHKESPEHLCGQKKESSLLSIGMENKHYELRGSLIPGKKLEDFGGANGNVLVAGNSGVGGMKKVSSSPSLSHYFGWIPGKNAENVDTQTAVPSCIAPVKNHEQIESGFEENTEGQESSLLKTKSLPATPSSSPKILRKTMENYISSGQEVNKYGGMFRKPGHHHKFGSMGAGIRPFDKVQEDTIYEAKEASLKTPGPQKSLTTRLQEWATTTMKPSEKEMNALAPTSF